MEKEMDAVKEIAPLEEAKPEKEKKKTNKKE